MALTRDDHDFQFVQFLSQGHDPFRSPDGFRPPAVSLLGTCAICHRDPGIHSVLSIVRDSGEPGFLNVDAGIGDHPSRHAVAAKRRSFSLGFLRGLAAAER